MQLSNKSLSSKEITKETFIRLLQSPSIYLDRYICVLIIKYKILLQKYSTYDISTIYYEKYKYLYYYVKGIEDKDEIKSLFNFMIYCYYKPDITINEQFFYEFYYHLLLNKNYLITSSSIDIYDFNLLNTNNIFETSNIFQLSIKKIYKMIIQYHQVNKIYDIVKSLDLKYNPLFYIFLFNLYYHLNHLDLNKKYFNCNYDSYKPVFKFNPSFDKSTNKLVCLYKNGNSKEYILTKGFTTNKKYVLYGLFIKNSVY